MTCRCRGIRCVIGCVLDVILLNGRQKALMLMMIRGENKSFTQKRIGMECVVVIAARLRAPHFVVVCFFFIKIHVGVMHAGVEYVWFLLGLLYSLKKIDTISRIKINTFSWFITVYVTYFDDFLPSFERLLRFWHDICLSKWFTVTWKKYMHTIRNYICKDI